jgi:hypothetical protein
MCSGPVPLAVNIQMIGGGMPWKTPPPKAGRSSLKSKGICQLITKYRILCWVY